MPRGFTRTVRLLPSAERLETPVAHHATAVPSYDGHKLLLFVIGDFPKHRLGNAN
jgi:hypothetical protein